MPVTTITQPIVEPITLTQVRDHLRITETTEDAYLMGLVGAVRRHTEHATRRALITRTVRYEIDCFPDSRVIDLPLPPVLSVSSLKYTDTAGTLQTYSSANYTVDNKSERGRLVLNKDLSWPSIKSTPLAVQVNYTAGYGSTTDAVPGDLVHAMLTLVASWYENRETDVIIPGISSVRVPNTFDHLISPYKERVF